MAKQKKQALTMPDIEGVSMPHNPKAEKYIIAVLLSGEKVDTILSHSEEIFFDRELKEIFKSAKRVRSAGGRIETGSIYSDMINDKTATTVFDDVARQQLGESWSFTPEKVNLRIQQAIVLGAILPDSGMNIDLNIRIAQEFFAKRTALQSAALLSNIDKIGQENISGYLSKIQDDLSRATSKSFSAYFRNETDEEIDEEMKSDQEGIGTNYYVFSGDQRAEIKIPRGQLSLICGLPGHCKSTMLLNLALRLAASENGQIIYLTFEEHKRRTSPKFVSLHYGKELNSTDCHVGGNIDRIREYHQGNTNNIGDIEGLEHSLAEIKRMRRSGKLKIISADWTSLDAVSGLRAHIAEGKQDVTAVFVDYIQYLRSGRNLETRHDIEEVARDFLNFAKETNIPVIAAAQLSRKATNPENMGGRHLAESADLTRLADMILCIWNSAKSEDIEEINAYKESSHYLNRLLKFGFDAEKGGAVYIKVSKARDLESGADAVYNYNGSTKAIGRPPLDSVDAIDTANPDNWIKKSSSTQQDKPNTTETKIRPDIRRR